MRKIKLFAVLSFVLGLTFIAILQVAILAPTQMFWVIALPGCFLFVGGNHFLVKWVLRQI